MRWMGGKGGGDRKGEKGCKFVGRSKKTVEIVEMKVDCGITTSGVLFAAL